MEEGYCYIPIRIDSGDSVTYEFVKEDNGESFENVQDPEAEISLDFATIRSELLAKFETGGTTFEDEYFWDDNYFMVMCIESIDTTSTRWANVRFWVGDRHVVGEITNDSDIKDFNYYAVIEL